MDLEEKSGFNRLWYLYKEALNSNCFIYDKNKRVWYTPEEFREKYDNDRLTHTFITGLLEDLVIRDPVAGIKAGQSQIMVSIEKFKTEMDKDLLKLAEFSRKTITYYQEKLKK